MVSMTTTSVNGREVTPDLVHNLLDEHVAWDKSFYEFVKLISERVEGNHTTFTRWDEAKLKSTWDLVHYIRRHYGKNL